MSTDPVDIRGLSSDDVWDHENGYYWFSDQSRINKLLAHYELYKRIVALPGDIHEFGVFKGLSLIRLAQFRALLEHESSRRIAGFDAFGKFPVDRLSQAADLNFVRKFEDDAGDGLSRAELALLLERKNFRNIELIEGNVFDTLPAYLERRPQTRIALLHLDLDVMEPTAFVLDALYDRIVRGGLIVFDDYNAVAGETDAVDAFLERTGLALQKLPYYTVPAFVVKP